MSDPDVVWQMFLSVLHHPMALSVVTALAVALVGQFLGDMPGIGAISAIVAIVILYMGYRDFEHFGGKGERVILCPVGRQFVRVDEDPWKLDHGRYVNTENNASFPVSDCRAMIIAPKGLFEDEQYDDFDADSPKPITI